MQKENNVYFMIADLHAFISRQEKDFIHKASIKQAKIYIALGLDLDKVILFRQHKVPAHSQLNWILSCMTTL
jgi:tryptophanyl-tRNA synthetase